MPRGDNAAKKGSGQVGFQRTPPKAVAAPPPSDIKSLPFLTEENQALSSDPQEYDTMMSVVKQRYEQKKEAAVAFAPVPPPNGDDPNNKYTKRAKNFVGENVKDYSITTKNWDNNSISKGYRNGGTSNPVDTVSASVEAPADPKPKNKIRARIRRAAVTATGLAFAVGSLTACGSNAESDQVQKSGLPLNEPTVTSFFVETPDGREIPCVWAEKYSEGGYGNITDNNTLGSLSCDWSYTK